MGVSWSFELHDDLAAPYDELYADRELEKLLSLLSDWLSRDGGWDPLKSGVSSSHDQGARPSASMQACIPKLALAASGSPAPAPSTWQSSCELQWPYASTIETEDTSITALRGFVPMHDDIRKQLNINPPR